jgi:putative DNA-invertase from lambdoid prophage Rac
MQRQGIDVGRAAADGRYKSRAKDLDPATVKAWRAEHGKSIAATAAEFDISTATVKQ